MADNIKPAASTRPEKAGPLASFHRTLTRTTAIASMMGLFLVALVTVCDVLMRWFFSQPIHGAMDIAGTAIILIAAASFVAGSSAAAHVSLPVAGYVLGPRASKIFDWIGALSMTIFMGAIAYYLLLHSYEMAEENRQLSVLGWPVAPWWYGATILIGLSALAHLVELFVSGDERAGIA
ncbi:MAG: TRAP transporter small permease [Rhodospirillaceae bacterium]|nr:TRAP transporter small permease [Rhodospirillaceae bacterium]